MDRRGSRRKNPPAVVLAALILVCTAAIISPAGAAVPGAQESQVPATPLELNVTNASLANATIPDQYQVTPTLVNIGISGNVSGAAGPKGEMAENPRTIGIALPPFVPALVILVIAVILAAVCYSKRKGPGNEKPPE